MPSSSAFFRTLAVKVRGVAVDLEAIAAVELARKIVPRHSIDLIYARQGQQLADWTGELQMALDLFKVRRLHRKLGKGPKESGGA